MFRPGMWLMKSVGIQRWQQNSDFRCFRICITRLYFQNFLLWGAMTALHFFLILFSGFRGFAQETELNQLLNQHHAYYNNLRGSRGMGEVSSPYSLSRIQKYLTILESDLNQTTVVLLFYAYDSNSQNLELWLIDHKGIKAKGQTKVLTDSLDVMYDQLLASLHLKAERGDRGAKVNGLNTSSLRDPMAFWEEVLFPGETTMAIHDYRHLLISPVKNLGMLPWYALKAPGTENARIIDYWDLEILESLSHFALLGKYESVYWHRFDTFSFNPVSPLIVCTPDYSACKENSLPGAWEEASMVGAMCVQVRRQNLQNCSKLTYGIDLILKGTSFISRHMP